eukprot:PLAT13309.1.p1 GENE.PLAT13309.1~~PLAT13309.1.p1  ORF type:complete len:269 (-),score=108.52 PLAT13309.1:52-858(-)
MGRVARKRKLKRCDPFSQTVYSCLLPKKHMDAPPLDDSDEELPEGMTHKRAAPQPKKRRKRRKLSEKLSEEEKAIMSELDAESQARKSMQEEATDIATASGRMPGESMAAFRRRNRLERSAIVRGVARKEHKLQGSRSDYRGTRRERRMQRRQAKEMERMEEKLLNEVKVEEVQFGDVAKAPPRLAVRPKLRGDFGGEELAARRLAEKAELLGKALGKAGKTAAAASRAAASGGRGGMKADIAALRARVLQSYKSAKAKKAARPGYAL